MVTSLAELEPGVESFSSDNSDVDLPLHRIQGINIF